MSEIHKIKLKDGREMGYVEFGDPKGFPVIYCHGWPSAKYEGLYFDPEAKEHGVRLISIDRPGMGDSTYKPDLTFYQWPDDVKELMDSLDIKNFGVFGVSGGTPYALACAHKLKDSVKRTYIYGGLAPIHSKNYGRKYENLKKLAISTNNIPNFTRRAIKVFRKVLRKRPKLYLWILKSRIPKEDRKRASQRGIDIFIKNKLDAIKKTAEGATHEAGLILNTWDFDIKDIESYVKFWIGTNDDLTPMEMTEYMNETIPNSEMSIIDAGSHFAITDIADEIFDTMKQGYAHN
ncbi:alpha/beta hydrolase [candidate division WWE3 bacterium]|jgi:pimeloyl-ACP methyl ester carboxylesterase|nr:alpha/beta hydrolase [candidate division WWE3 bacterium]MBT7350425.1 alpha/beta hydrolase [candidate division WWE3 bacterium]